MCDYPREFKERFWAKVTRSASCWLWTASTTQAGYGQIQARRISSRPLLAHRVSWELRNGPIPAGQHVLHKCDTPSCVRPDHLFLGTQRDNNRDRDTKGRTARGGKNGARTAPERNPFVRDHGSKLHGEKHPQAKLTDAQAESLRRDFDAGEKRADLAAKYGISLTHVYRIGARSSRKGDSQ